MTFPLLDDNVINNKKKKNWGSGRHDGKPIFFFGRMKKNKKQNNFLLWS